MENNKIKSALKIVESKTKLNLSYFKNDFPSASTENYNYDIVKNEDWTEGFWTGILWMMYQYSGDTLFRATANANVTSFTERMKKDIVLDHHDLGFLYSLSCFASYKLTKDDNAKKQVVLAADKLLKRWHEEPGFIQAWGSMDDDSEHRFIIDSLLNMPLLYRASDISGDNKYRNVATRHYSICVDHLIRENGSSYHTFFVDRSSKTPTHGSTFQGYADDSSWARGQAWSIYGIALNYGESPSEDKMNKFKSVTKFFIDKLPKDHVSYWDLDFTDGSDQARDSSATAIAICGILEMIQYISDKEYVDSLMESVSLMIESLIDNYSNKDLIKGAPLLNEGVYSWHQNKGVNEGNLWGDYFYVEALMRLSNPEWKPYW